MREFFTSLSTRQKFGVALFFIALVSISLGVYLVRQRQQLRSSASTANCNVELMLVPLSGNSGTVGSAFQVGVYMNTGTRDISGAEFTVRFPTANLRVSQSNPFTNSVDNKKFDYLLRPSAESLTSGDELNWKTQILGESQTEYSSGKVHFLAVNRDITKQTKTTSCNNTGDRIELGRINFESLAAGSANISFDTTTSPYQFVEAGKQSPVASTVITFTNASYTINSLPTATPTLVPPTATSTPVPPTATVTPVPPTPTPTRIPGDATNNRCVNTTDRTCWLYESSSRSNGNSADFNDDGRINRTDYTIWLNAKESNRYTTCIPVQNEQCINQR